MSTTINTGQAIRNADQWTPTNGQALADQYRAELDRLIDHHIEQMTATRSRGGMHDINSRACDIADLTLAVHRLELRRTR